MSYCNECRVEVMHNSPPSDRKHVIATDSNGATSHSTSCSHSSKNKEQQEPGNNNYNTKELPRIPVAMRHPYMITSVRQYRSDAQQIQLQQHIISESFVPVIPYSADRPARKRRRPPFSCSSLIIQAISTSETGQMTLQDIYKWILNKYPSLYNEEDTGWQNTIRHNLSLNKCFKKIPKSISSRGKGGYWSLDSKYIEDEGLKNISKKNQRRMSPNSNSNTRPEEQTSSSSSITTSHTNKRSSSSLFPSLSSSSQQQRMLLHASSLSLVPPSPSLPSSTIIHSAIKASTASSPVTTQLPSSSTTSTSSLSSSSSSSLSSPSSLPPSINPTTHVMQIQSILN